MNGFILLLPLLLLRYLVLYLLNPASLKRALHLPPMAGQLQFIYWIYQISTLVMLLYPAFLRLDKTKLGFYPGLLIYLGGIILGFLALVAFSKTNENGFCNQGIYRYFRHPIYLSYFFYFLGCALLLHSLVLLVNLAILQLATHFIVKAEEQWCLANFGSAYLQYCQTVRRFL